ncbi:unnamed protein product [Amoebophrya sp. A120]|nr:unnamed protein product [Amoebophrya sp. A120]|eukprot:GSA120T00003076001.1
MAKRQTSKATPAARSGSKSKPRVSSSAPSSGKVKEVTKREAKQADVSKSPQRNKENKPPGGGNKEKHHSNEGARAPMSSSSTSSKAPVAPPTAVVPPQQPQRTLNLLAWGRFFGVPQLQPGTNRSSGEQQAQGGATSSKASQHQPASKLQFGPKKVVEEENQEPAPSKRSRPAERTILAAPAVSSGSTSKATASSASAQRPNDTAGITSSATTRVSVPATPGSGDAGTTKRGRGRPRKHPLAEQQTPIEAPSDGNVGASKPPKKSKTPPGRSAEVVKGESGKRTGGASSSSSKVATASTSVVPREVVQIIAASASSSSSQVRPPAATTASATSSSSSFVAPGLRDRDQNKQNKKQMKMKDDVQEPEDYHTHMRSAPAGTTSTSQVKLPGGYPQTVTATRTGTVSATLTRAAADNVAKKAAVEVEQLAVPPSRTSKSAPSHRRPDEYRSDEGDRHKDHKISHEKETEKEKTKRLAHTTSGVRDTVTGKRLGSVPVYFCKKEQRAFYIVDRQRVWVERQQYRTVDDVRNPAGLFPHETHEKKTSRGSGPGNGAAGSSSTSSSVAAVRPSSSTTAFGGAASSSHTRPMLPPPVVPASSKISSAAVPQGPGCPLTKTAKIMPEKVRTPPRFHVSDDGIIDESPCYSPEQPQPLLQVGKQIPESIARMSQQWMSSMWASKSKMTSIGLVQDGEKMNHSKNSASSAQAASAGLDTPISVPIDADQGADVQAANFNQFSFQADPVQHQQPAILENVYPVGFKSRTSGPAAPVPVEEQSCEGKSENKSPAEQDLAPSSVEVTPEVSVESDNDPLRKTPKNCFLDSRNITLDRDDPYPPIEVEEEEEEEEPLQPAPAEDHQDCSSGGVAAAGEHEGEQLAAENQIAAFRQDAEDDDVALELESPKVAKSAAEDEELPVLQLQEIEDEEMLEVEVADEGNAAERSPDPEDRQDAVADVEQHMREEAEPERGESSPSHDGEQALAVVPAAHEEIPTPNLAEEADNMLRELEQEEEVARQSSGSVSVSDSQIEQVGGDSHAGVDHDAQPGNRNEDEILEDEEDAGRDIAADSKDEAITPEEDQDSEDEVADMLSPAQDGESDAGPGFQQHPSEEDDDADLDQEQSPAQGAPAMDQHDPADDDSVAPDEPSDESEPVLHIEEEQADRGTSSSSSSEREVVAPQMSESESAVVPDEIAEHEEEAPAVTAAGVLAQEIVEHAEGDLEDGDEEFSAVSREQEGGDGFFPANEVEEDADDARDLSPLEQEDFSSHMEEEGSFHSGEGSVGVQEDEQDRVHLPLHGHHHHHHYQDSFAGRGYFDSYQDDIERNMPMLHTPRGPRFDHGSFDQRGDQPMVFRGTYLSPITEVEENDLDESEIHEIRKEWSDENNAALQQDQVQGDGEQEDGTPPHGTELLEEKNDDDIESHRSIEDGEDRGAENDVDEGSALGAQMLRDEQPRGEQLVEEEDCMEDEDLGEAPEADSGFFRMDFDEEDEDGAEENVEKLLPEGQEKARPLLALTRKNLNAIDSFEESMSGGEENVNAADERQQDQQERQLQTTALHAGAAEVEGEEEPLSALDLFQDSESPYSSSAGEERVEKSHHDGQRAGEDLPAETGEPVTTLVEEAGGKTPTFGVSAEDDSVVEQGDDHSKEQSENKASTPASEQKQGEAEAAVAPNAVDYAEIRNTSQRKSKTPLSRRHEFSSASKSNKSERESVAQPSSAHKEELSQSAKKKKADDAAVDAVFRFLDNMNASASRSAKKQNHDGAKNEFADDALGSTDCKEFSSSSAASWFGGAGGAASSSSTTAQRPEFFGVSYPTSSSLFALPAQGLFSDEEAPPLNLYLQAEDGRRIPAVIPGNPARLVPPSNFGSSNQELNAGPGGDNGTSVYSRSVMSSNLAEESEKQEDPTPYLSVSAGGDAIPPEESVDLLPTSGLFRTSQEEQSDQYVDFHSCKSPRRLRFSMLQEASNGGAGADAEGTAQVATLHASRSLPGKGDDEEDEHKDIPAVEPQKTEASASYPDVGFLEDDGVEDVGAKSKTPRADLDHEVGAESAGLEEFYLQQHTSAPAWEEAHEGGNAAQNEVSSQKVIDSKNAQQSGSPASSSSRPAANVEDQQEQQNGNSESSYEESPYDYNSSSVSGWESSPERHTYLGGGDYVYYNYERHDFGQSSEVGAAADQDDLDAFQYQPQQQQHFQYNNECSEEDDDANAWWNCSSPSLPRMMPPPPNMLPPPAFQQPGFMNQAPPAEIPCEQLTFFLAPVQGCPESGEFVANLGSKEVPDGEAAVAEQLEAAPPLLENCKEEAEVNVAGSVEEPPASLPELEVQVEDPDVVPAGAVCEDRAVSPAGAQHAASNTPRSTSRMAPSPIRSQSRKRTREDLEEMIDGLSSVSEETPQQEQESVASVKKERHSSKKLLSAADAPADEQEWVPPVLKRRRIEQEGNEADAETSKHVKSLLGEVVANNQQVVGDASRSSSKSSPSAASRRVASLGVDSPPSAVVNIFPAEKKVIVPDLRLGGSLVERKDGDASSNEADAGKEEEAEFSPHDEQGSPQGSCQSELSTKRRRVLTTVTPPCASVRVSPKKSRESLVSRGESIQRSYASVESKCKSKESFVEAEAASSASASSSPGQEQEGATKQKHGPAGDAEASSSSASSSSSSWRTPNAGGRTDKDPASSSAKELPYHSANKSPREVTLEQEKAALEKELQALRRQRMHETAQHDDVGDQLRSLLKSKKKLQEELDQKTNLSDALLAEKTEQSEKVTHMETQIAQQQENIQNLQTAEKRLEAKLSSMKDQELARRNRVLEQRVQKMEQDLESAEKERLRFADQVNSGSLARNLEQIGSLSVPPPSSSRTPGRSLLGALERPESLLRRRKSSKNPGTGGGAAASSGASLLSRYQ